MKRFLKIFGLSTNEQRVVLLIMFFLIAFALVAYLRRIHPSPVESPVATQPKPSQTALGGMVGDQ